MTRLLKKKQKPPQPSHGDGSSVTARFLRRPDQERAALQDGSDEEKKPYNDDGPPARLVLFGDEPPQSLILFGDEQIEFSEVSLEMSALSGLDEQVRLAIENIDYKTLAAHVAQLEALDPEFEAELKAARTARHAFSEAASAADASQPVPDKAPRLWSERDKRTEKNPAEFIRSNYAFCMANLGQHHFLTLDRGLYRRYVDWKDEPKELVNGKIRPCDQPVEFGSTTRLSDEERGRRAREQSNTTKAKKRAQQTVGCDIRPHSEP